MLSRVYSCAVVGLDGVVVEVEVDTTRGLPGTDIVGLLNAAVKESRERVQAAIKNSGLPYPRKRIIVNLAPAAVRKEGPTYDLPIALGVLLMQMLVPPDSMDKAMVIGELSLDGTVRHSKGILPMAASARAEGFKRIFVPEVDAAEAALIPDLDVIPVKSLSELYRHLIGEKTIEPQRVLAVDKIPIPSNLTDFSEIKGQEHV
ncbi:MAG: ATP-binding protein, partial [Anaerolineae bacterium]|nr:ATP-binding protein [Anaerolineae bacterium]